MRASFSALLLLLALPAQAQVSDHPCSAPAMVELRDTGAVAFEGAEMAVDELMARLEERRRADHDASCVTLLAGRQSDPVALDDLVKRLKARWYSVRTLAGPPKRY